VTAPLLLLGAATPIPDVHVVADNVAAFADPGRDALIAISSVSAVLWTGGLIVLQLRQDPGNEGAQRGPRWSCNPPTGAGLALAGTTDALAGTTAARAGTTAALTNAIATTSAIDRTRALRVTRSRLIGTPATATVSADALRLPPEQTPRVAGSQRQPGRLIERRDGCDHRARRIFHHRERIVATNNKMIATETLRDEREILRIEH